MLTTRTLKYWPLFSESLNGIFTPGGLLLIRNGPPFRKAHYYYLIDDVKFSAPDAVIHVKYPASFGFSKVTSSFARDDSQIGTQCQGSVPILL